MSFIAIMAYVMSGLTIVVVNKCLLLTGYCQGNNPKL